MLLELKEGEKEKYLKSWLIKRISKIVETPGRKEKHYLRPVELNIGYGAIDSYQNIAILK